MEATRTLVKSPPELWAELSDVAALTRHLGEFGEIRITRTEPESVVEWEGDRASGSVRLEPSGWGTRVTLTVESPAEQAGAEPAQEAADPTEAVPAGDDVDEAPVAEPVDAEPADSAETPRDEEAADATSEAAEPTQPEPEPDATPRRGFFARLFGWRARRAARKARAADEEAEAEPSGEVASTEAPESVADDEAPAADCDVQESPEPVAPDAPPAAESEPQESPEPVAAAAPPAENDTGAPATHDPAPDAAAILAQTLDALGAAHHRPFSR